MSNCLQLNRLPFNTEKNLFYFKINCSLKILRKMRGQKNVVTNENKTNEVTNEKKSF